MCSLVVALRKGTSWVALLSWMWMVWRSSRLDDTMVPGAPTAESFTLWDALQCLIKLIHNWLALRCPVWVFSNCQLMIYFLTCIFKWPQCHSIYWAIEDAKAEK